MTSGARAEARARRTGRLERWTRVMVYFVCFLGVFIYAELLGAVWAVALTRRSSSARVRRSNIVYQHWGRALTWLTLRVLDSTLEVRGDVPPGRYVVVANHQSTADIAILIARLRPLNCKFVAKRALGRGIPAISLALARGGGALISRRPSKDDLEALRRMGRDLARWEGSAIIFPEGTRSRDGNLLRYRSAALRIVAGEANLPFLPVAVDGTWPASDLKRFATRMPGRRMYLAVGEPIAVAAWREDLDAVLGEIRDWTARTLEAARSEGIVDTPPQMPPRHVGDDADPGP